MDTYSFSQLASFHRPYECLQSSVQNCKMGGDQIASPSKIVVLPLVPFMYA